jgi:hypothetical protein
MTDSLSSAQKVFSEVNAGEGKSVVYDPDPTDMQLQYYDSIRPETLNAADLSNPAQVTVLLANWRVSLLEVKLLKSQNLECKTENSKLRDDVANLRVELAESRATSSSKSKYTYLEIPISMLSGYAINLLSNNIGNGIGWFILSISIVVLLFLRGDDLLEVYRKSRTNR